MLQVAEPFGLIMANWTDQGQPWAFGAFIVHWILLPQARQHTHLNPTSQSKV